jgi:histidinol-phosphate/aromatic aminotransferase/cobyric acid decarboxylase-like protein
MDRDSLYIEDPANPTGNDMSQALTDEIRNKLSKVASDTIAAVDEHGWEHVFGAIESAKAAMPRVQVLRSAAASVAVPMKPWGCAD